MEQLDRAKRYLSRLRYAYEGIQDSSGMFSIENPKDDCISFFMHCYHIKDWIQHLYCKTLEEKQSVEDFINDNDELKICADLSNGSKHYRLRDISKYRSGEHQDIELSDYKAATYITGTGGLEIHKCRFNVESANASFDALKLAEKCIELWSNYISHALDKSINLPD